MGNYVSCTLAGPVGKQHRSAKVILPTGEVCRFYNPVKAAEIMLEIPGHFLQNSKSLRIGRRFSPLNADEDLEMSNAYVMFPIKRANSVIKAADMGGLYLATKRASFGKGKILPEGDLLPLPEKEEMDTAAPLPKLNLDDVEEVMVMKQRLSMCRSKKPMLETISEEFVWSR